MRRLILLAGPILVILVIAAAASAALGGHHNTSHNVIVIKPQNTNKNSSSIGKCSSSNIRWVEIPLVNGVLRFYTTQLKQFQVSGNIVEIGFLGKLVLGQGTYVLYNVSSCHISGNMEILRIFDSGIEIRVLKTVTITDCDHVVIRVT